MKERLKTNLKDNLQEWKEHWREFLEARHESGWAWWLAVAGVLPPFLVIAFEPLEWIWRVGLAEAVRLALGRI